MTKVIDSTNIPLDSEYRLEEYQNVPGLVLESWGPSHRNPDYNKALDLLLSRLQELGVLYISVNVISRQLKKVFPDFNARVIRIGGSGKLNLHRVSPTELRTEIGRAQARLKLDPSTSGGNRTKRILIHSPLIDFALWEEIAKGTASPAVFMSHIEEPTIEREVLDSRVEALLGTNIAQPSGNLTPGKTTKQSEEYLRNPAVKAWVLKVANGTCELCNCPAPFVKDGGEPYLEVHHVRSLSEGGSDTVENALALCPNCHMKMHYAADRFELRKLIVGSIERIAYEAVI